MVDDFGDENQVAIYGDIAVVSAHTSIDVAGHSGVAIIYQKVMINSVEEWQYVRTIKSPNPGNDDKFGHSIDLYEDILVVAADRYTNIEGQKTGAVYIFYRHQGGQNKWGWVKTLIPDSPAFTRFGKDVSIHNNTIAVGANESDQFADYAGAVYIFSKDLGGIDNWGEETIVGPSDPEDFENFGITVDIFEDHMVVAGIKNNIFIFQQNQIGMSTWEELHKIQLDDPNGSFFLSVAIAKENILVGKDNYDNSRGIVYSFQQISQSPSV